MSERTWGVAVAIALTLAPAIARADDPRVEPARRHHRDLEFEKCLDVLRGPPPPLATDAERAEVELLNGICNFELAREAIAGEHFRRALRAEGRVTLPAYSSPKMRDAFARAQEEVAAENAKEDRSRARSREEVATSPRPASAPDAHARSNPFPVLGVVLGGAALGLGTFGTYSYVLAKDLESDANRARFESDAYSIGDRARTNMVVANVFIVGAIALAGAAVIAVLKE